MRKIFSIIVLAGIMMTLQTAVSFAEETIGCPLGLKQGTWWIRTAYKSKDMTKKYNSTKDEMQDLVAGEYSRPRDLMVRLGYGLTDAIDVGVVLPYASRDSKKKKGAGWETKEGSGLADVWLAGKYTFVKDSGRIEGLGVGIAYKLASASDDLVKKGIGNGASEAKIGILSHIELAENVSCCNHLVYNWKGKTRKISGYTKSEWDLADKVDYKLFLEYSPWEKFGIVGGLKGWMNMAKDKDASGAEKGGDFFSHGVNLHFVYFPAGHEIEHKKIFLGLRYPYSAKNSWTPSFAATLCGMWTF